MFKQIAWLTILLMSFPQKAADSSKRHDPFDPSLEKTSQVTTGSAATGPSLRVVLAGSSGGSMKELADWSNKMARWLNPGSVVDQVDPRHFKEDLNKVLGPMFRSIEYVYWNAPESQSQVDYVLTLDIKVAIGKHSFAENLVEIEGTLAAAGEGQKEPINGHGKSKVGYPATIQHFTEAREAAFSELAQNLKGSQLVASYGNSTHASTGAQTASGETSSPGTSRAGVTNISSVTGSKKSAARAGLYNVESKINFNVLDSVYFDPGTGELALIGHHDDRFKGENTPYLQDLATLLESPKPEFSLEWTPDSSRRVDSLLARELTQRESDAQGARLGTMVDSSGLITHTGALMLPALGIYPVNDNRPPGDLGIEVQSIQSGRVVVMKVRPGSAADKAGLKQIDFIVSVRKDHRPVYFASEFERQVRALGAGAETEVTYQRNGALYTTKAILDAASNADPWHGINRYDLIGLMYRGAGDPAPGDVIEAMGIMNTAGVEKIQTAGLEAYTELMRAMNMTTEFEHLRAVAGDTAAPYADAYNYGLKLSMQLDSIFHFSGSPLENDFKSAVQRSHDPGSAASQVMNDFDQQLKPKIGELIDHLIFRPGVGFQIPPEIVEDEYHIRPEMTPKYLGVPADSQLARLMLASDYLGKQLSNRQDLKRTIPGYQTQVEYQINHPEANHKNNSAYRLWISVASINAPQSTDGKMIALRDVRMRFNISETDNVKNDLPNQPRGGYEDVLTGLYDQFELQFPDLHELREAAKLSAVAAWMQKHDAAIRLPMAGRASWTGPDHVNGLVYIYLTVNLKHESKIIKMAEGGVSLVMPNGNGAALFPNDPSVVDARGSSSMTTVFARPETATVAEAPDDASAGASRYVAGWVSPVASGTPGQQAVVLQARSPVSADTVAVSASAGTPTVALNAGSGAGEPGVRAMGIPGLPGINLNDVEPAHAAQLADQATSLSGPDRSMVEDVALEAAQKNPELTAPSDDPFVTNFQKETESYDAAMKRQQVALQKVHEAEGRVQGATAAITYAGQLAQSPNATDAQKQAFQQMQAAATTDEGAAAAARQIFEQTDVHLSIVRERAADSLAVLAPPAVKVSAPPNNVPPYSGAPTMTGVRGTAAPVGNSPAVVNLNPSAKAAMLGTPSKGGKPYVMSVSECVASYSPTGAVPTLEELQKNLESAMNAMEQIAKSQENANGSREDWAKVVSDAHTDIFNNGSDTLLGGLLNVTTSSLEKYKESLHEGLEASMAESKQLRAEYKAISNNPAEKALWESKKSEFLSRAQIQLENNAILGDALAGVETVKGWSEKFQTGRDFYLWLTDTEMLPCKFGNDGKINCDDLKKNSGITKFKEGDLNARLDLLKQVMKFGVHYSPAIKALSHASLIGDTWDIASMTIDLSYDATAIYLSKERLKRVKQEDAQLARAREVLGARLERLNAEIGCYQKGH
jgi:hypothetical protein